MRVGGKNAVALGVVLAAAALLAIPMTVAHVIFVYQSLVKFNATTPVVWEAGPDAGAVSLTVTNKTSVMVSMAIPVTNATEIYVYQPLELVVTAGTPTLYVDKCPYSTSYSWTPSSVELIVYPTTGSPSSPTGTITITPSTSSSTSSCQVSYTLGSGSSSNGIPLTSGSYYIDVEVIPTLPAPHEPAGTTVGTLTLYLSVTNSTSPVTVPT